MPFPSAQSRRRRVALVLSGGGARGAYEVGILSNLLPRMAALGMDFDILVATSVGALNACALASTAHYGGVAGARLRASIMREGWEGLDNDRIFISRYLSSILSLPLHLSNVRGPHPLDFFRRRGLLRERLRRLYERTPYRFTALYDTSPLRRTLAEGGLIDWEQLRRNLDAGRPQALAISATGIRSGETLVFTQSRMLNKERVIADEHLRMVPVRIEGRHALASAAIPFLFPPVRVPLPGTHHKVLMMDGGIRLNTPLLPAILLGADSIIAIGLHSAVSESSLDADASLEADEEAFEVIPMIGKILNAFFLDRMRTDFNRLTIMNKLIANTPPERLAEMNAERRSRGKDPLREIRAVELQPSKDIGSLVARIWERSPGLRRSPLRLFIRDRNLHGAALGDLLSYISFHPDLTRALIALGESDAAVELTRDALRWLGGLDDLS